MKVVIQRVSEASVKIKGRADADIEQGLLLLVGFEDRDTAEDLQKMAQKILQLRIFNDELGKMNLSVKDIHGDILLISQFTLFANTKKGKRPSFIKAAKPEIAIPLYNSFIEKIEHELERKISTGVFGAEMKVSLINDGPVTIILDSHTAN